MCSAKKIRQNTGQGVGEPADSSVAPEGDYRVDLSGSAGWDVASNQGYGRQEQENSDESKWITRPDLE